MPIVVFLRPLGLRLVLWAIIVILLTSMSYFDSMVLLDEAAQTDIMHTLTRDWFYDVLCTYVASECLFIQL